MSVKFAPVEKFSNSVTPIIFIISSNIKSTLHIYIGMVQEQRKKTYKNQGNP